MENNSPVFNFMAEWVKKVYGDKTEKKINSILKVKDWLKRRKEYKNLNKHILKTSDNKEYWVFYRVYDKVCHLILDLKLKDSFDAKFGSILTNMTEAQEKYMLEWVKYYSQSSSKENKNE